MSAAIANSFIFRESYFAEEVLQFQHPTRIDEDEDNNTYGLDYIRKYVEQLTADAKLQLQSPPALSSLHSSPAAPLSSSPSTSATHAAIIAFDFSSIQVSPSASVPPSSSTTPSVSIPANISSSSSPNNNNNNNDSSSTSSSLPHHEDNANRPENELDLPRYLSWFDEEALASDCDEDDAAQSEVLFYDDDDDDAEDVEEADDDDQDDDDDSAVEVPLFIGQQAQLQIFEVTKKFQQSLTPDSSSLSTSPSSFSLLLESPNCDTFKRKNCDSSSEPKKSPAKRVKRCSQQS